MTAPNPYGSDTRATDGVIVTFELEDGSIRVEQFSQIIHVKDRLTDKNGRRMSTRTKIKIGDPYILQAATRADELGAKILCISSPQTIVTDMQGTRAALKGRDVRGSKRGERHQIPNDIRFPEMRLLGNIGRVDLFKPPKSGLQPKQNVRQARHGGQN